MHQLNAKYKNAAKNLQNLDILHGDLIFFECKLLILADYTLNIDFREFTNVIFSAITNLQPNRQVPSLDLEGNQKLADKKYSSPYKNQYKQTYYSPRAGYQSIYNEGQNLYDNIPQNSYSARPNMNLMQMIKNSKNPNYLIKKPQIKTVKVLDQSYIDQDKQSKTLTEDYIRGIIQNDFLDTQASIIQRAFRQSKSRTHTKKFLKIRMKQNERLKQLIIIIWKLSSIKNTLKLHRSYDQLLNFLPFVHYVLKDRQVSPFRYFYVSGEVFVPNSYTHKNLYKLIFTCNKPCLLKILTGWKIFAHKNEVQRTNLIFSESTNNKIAKFKSAFVCFNLWKNLTNYSKIKAKSDITKTPSITVPDHDKVPVWLATQTKLNKIQKLQYQSAVQYNTKLAKRSLNALFTYYKTSKNRCVVIPSMIKAKNNSLMTKVLVIWVNIINKKKKLRNFVREFIKRWYKRTFKHSFYDEIDRFSRRSSSKFRLFRALNGWAFVARRRRIKYLNTSLTVHRKPLLAYMLIYAVSGNFDLAFHILAFKLWINIIKRRKQFRNFVKFHENLTHDAELAYGTLTMLRSPDEAENIFPNGIGLSLELSIVAQKLAQNGRILKLNHRKQIGKNVRMSPLARLFLLAIHQQVNFDVFETAADFEEKEESHQLHSEDELTNRTQENAKILRSRLLWKLHRDNSLLTVMSAHTWAQKYNELVPEFRTMEEATFFVKNDWLKPIEGEIYVFKDFKTSVNALVRALDITRTRPKLQVLFEEKKIVIEDLCERIRRPEKINMDVFEPEIKLKSSITTKEETETQGKETPKKQSKDIEILSQTIKNLSPDLKQAIKSPELPAESKSPRFKKK